MSHAALDPRPVTQPRPCTVLESAMQALDEETAKSIHLSPRQAEALLHHIGHLEAVEQLYLDVMLLVRRVQEDCDDG